MTKLEDHIRWAILNYPTLYRAKNYRDSRILVLNQLFFVIGNGYEWQPDGTLAGHSIDEIALQLPKDFFRKTLYTFDADPKKIKQLTKALGDRWHYMTEEKMHGNKQVVFQAAKKQAEGLAFDFEAAEGIGRSSLEWREQMGRKDYYVSEAACYLRKHYPFDDDQPHVCTPYPLCRYSALVEILNGRTDSPHIDNFDLVPQPDWLAGCVDMAKYALNFYNDKGLCKLSHYHPSQSVSSMEYDYAEARKKKRVKEWRKNMGWRTGTIKERCQKSWDRYHKEQLKYLTDFLAKFGA